MTTGIQNQTLDTLRALIQGKDPHTGLATPRTELIQREEILSALRSAATILARLEGAKTRAEEPLGKRGQSWSEDEVQLLITEFERGAKIATLASTLKRTPSAVHARLIAMGRLDPSIDYSER